MPVLVGYLLLFAYSTMIFTEFPRLKTFKMFNGLLVVALVAVAVAGGLGLSALMFALMVMMLQNFMTPMNIAVNAGCFSDTPAIAPRDLATCTPADVDASLRRKALATVRKHGKPSGLLFSSAPPGALEELYAGASNPAARSVRRRGRRVFGMKKRGAVSASIH